MCVCVCVRACVRACVCELERLCELEEGRMYNYVINPEPSRSGQGHTLAINNLQYALIRVHSTYGSLACLAPP